MQRLRLRFGRGAPVRFISHLDTMRCWERVFRRASVPIEYTQGFTPHPKIAVAVPLAVGVTSDAEVMDVWLRKWVPPQSAMMLARRELPPGFTLFDVVEVPEGAPALQVSVRTARYRCVAGHPEGLDVVRGAVDSFLRSESVVHSFSRGEEVRTVDLRPFVHSIEVTPCPDTLFSIDLEVSVGQDGSARPDHVLSVLGFALPAESIHRMTLSFGWPEEKPRRPSAHQR